MFTVFSLWDDLSLELDTSICTEVLTDIVSLVECVRTSTALSLRKLLEEDNEHLSTVLEMAMSLYQEKLYVSNRICKGIYYESIHCMYGIYCYVNILVRSGLTTDS